jgi:hypothetical protein
VRRVWAPIIVGAARLRARPGRTLLLLVGVAAAVSMLAAVFGGSLVAQDRALRRSIDDLPVEERTFRVDLIGFPAQQDQVRMDRTAQAALSGLTRAAPRRVTFFRDFWLDGELVRLAGVDHPADFVRLRSGRFPRTCMPSACEVLQIGTTGRPLLREGGIDLVRVGTGDLQDTGGLGPAFKRLTRARAQASIVTSTVLLAPNAPVLERLPALQLLFRVRSWVAPLASSAVHAWDIDSVLRRETIAQGVLDRADPSFALTGPDSALRDASERGGPYAQRMILVGGVAAALLLGFVMLGAIGLRRGIASERRRLFQRGATRSQTWIALFTEVGGITLAGWLVGVLLGVVAVALMAALVGVPAGAAVAHSLVRPQAAVALLAAWLIAAAVVVATVAAEESDDRRKRIRILDVAALGAALAVVVGVTRGALRADDTGFESDETLLVILPGLVCFAGGVAAARLLGPLMRLGEKLSRSGPLAIRLALLALARAPARTAVAGAFLVVSVGLVLFAAGYRATLDRGARDEAAFAVPLDVTLSEGSKLVLPLEASPLAGYDRLAAGVHAYPIIRRTADLADVGTATQAATVVGVPAAALAGLHWRSDFSSVSQANLAKQLSVDEKAVLRGAAIPTGATGFRLRTELRGTPLELELAVEDARGRIETVPIGVARPGSALLVASIPRRLRERVPRRIIGLELSLPKSRHAWLLHLAHEGRAVRAPSGSVLLYPLAALGPTGRRTQITDFREWIVRGSGATLAPGSRPGVRYSFPEGETFVVRPPQPTDDRPLRVIASPAVARASGHDHLLTLDFFDSRVRARVVATADRFPTLQPDEQFVIADETGLATALDADAPGTSAPLELWLSVPPGVGAAVERGLREPPLSSFDRTSRRELLRALDRDPLARAIAYTLEAAALFAIGLAVLGLWVTVLSDLRDERSDFFDLEAQGLSPTSLRRYVRVRAWILGAFGLIGGVLLGVVLSRLVVSLVQISAAAAAPNPPLVFAPGWLSILVTLLALAAAFAATVELSLRHAFRGEVPERVAWSLE